MVELCEQEPRYATRFRLTEEERRNLYTYWEINWTARRDLAAARPIAFRKLFRLFSYSSRTRGIILGCSLNPIVKAVLPKRLVQRIKAQPKAATTADIRPVVLDWWKN